MNKLFRKQSEKISKHKSKSKSNPKLKSKVLEIIKPPKLTTNRSKILKPKEKDSKEITHSIILKRQTPSRCKSRPKSTMSNTYKRQKEMQFKYNLNELVTEEDMIIISEQTELQLLPTLNMPKIRKPTPEVMQQIAATLIQKTWKGFKTRRIVKHYINMYRKVEQDHPDILTQKKQHKKHSREPIQQTDKYSININMNVNISPIPQYIFYTEQNQSLTQSDSGKKKMTNSKKVFLEQQQARSDSSFEIDPMIRVAQMQIKIIGERQEQQLHDLKIKFNKKKISTKFYTLKKNNIINHFNEERSKLMKSKSQLSFGFLKIPLSTLYPQISKLKTNLCYSEERLVLKKIIENESDDNGSLDMQFTYKDPPKVKKRTECLQDESDYINTSDLQNVSMESLQVHLLRQHVDYIQNNLENRLIDQFAVEFYLTESINSLFLPFFDLNSIYKFQTVSIKDVEKFIDLMLNELKPSDDEILSKMNQKINPTPIELFRILRNEDGCMDDQFYELVLPETVFKAFRQYKQNQHQEYVYKLPKQFINPLALDILTPVQKRKFEIKQNDLQEKRKRIKRYQQDLHAMYYKAVFNCLNQSIIQTKCSYSSISGRSTIGPGELRVSLLDSNSKVSKSQIPFILQKAKNTVMTNFKYSCPSLQLSSFQSVYRFQDTMMKQLQSQIKLTEHKWMSFFDEHLEIAMEINGVVEEQLMLEVVKDIYWMFFKR